MPAALALALLLALAAAPGTRGGAPLPKASTVEHGSFDRGGMEACSLGKQGKRLRLNRTPVDPGAAGLDPDSGTPSEAPAANHARAAPRRTDRAAQTALRSGISRSPTRTIPGPLSTWTRRMGRGMASSGERGMRTPSAAEGR